MDPRYKTPLAVVAGILIGMTLLGGVLAIPAMFRAAHSVVAGAEFRGGPGMMGDRWSQDSYGPGMMRDRRYQDSYGPGMMRRWQQGDSVAPGCGPTAGWRGQQTQPPCGGDPDACPRVSDDASDGV